ncbi:unnamed protein product [Amoebophrya sp. A120]|nr:unnamed protein product [Amoebophrya sp. A120]|eukprot:GSA120T00005867001.1
MRKLETMEGRSEDEPLLELASSGAEEAVSVDATARWMMKKVKEGQEKINQVSGEKEPEHERMKSEIGFHIRLADYTRDLLLKTGKMAYKEDGMLAACSTDLTNNPDSPSALRNFGLGGGVEQIDAVDAFSKQARYTTTVICVFAPIGYGKSSFAEFLVKEMNDRRRSEVDAGRGLHLQHPELVHIDGDALFYPDHAVVNSVSGKPPTSNSAASSSGKNAASSATTGSTTSRSTSSLTSANVKQTWEKRTMSLGQERQPYTMWSVLLALHCGKIPVISAGGGVLFSQKGQFALREKIEQCFSCLENDVEVINDEMQEQENYPEHQAAQRTSSKKNFYNQMKKSKRRPQILRPQVKIIGVLPEDVKVEGRKNKSAESAYENTKLVEQTVKYRVAEDIWPLPPNFNTVDQFAKMISGKSRKNEQFAEKLENVADVVFRFPRVGPGMRLTCAHSSSCPAADVVLAAVDGRFEANEKENKPSGRRVFSKEEDLVVVGPSGSHQIINDINKSEQSWEERFGVAPAWGAPPAKPDVVPQVGLMVEKENGSNDRANKAMNLGTTNASAQAHAEGTSKAEDRSAVNSLNIRNLFEQIHSAIEVDSANLKKFFGKMRLTQTRQLIQLPAGGDKNTLTGHMTLRFGPVEVAFSAAPSHDGDLTRKNVEYNQQINELNMIPAAAPSSGGTRSTTSKYAETIDFVRSLYFSTGQVQDDAKKEEKLKHERSVATTASSSSCNNLLGIRITAKPLVKSASGSGKKKDQGGSNVVSCVAIPSSPSQWKACWGEITSEKKKFLNLFDEAAVELQEGRRSVQLVVQQERAARSSPVVQEEPSPPVENYPRPRTRTSSTTADEKLRSFLGTISTVVSSRLCSCSPVLSRGTCNAAPAAAQLSGTTSFGAPRGAAATSTSRSAISTTIVPVVPPPPPQINEELPSIHSTPQNKAAPSRGGAGPASAINNTKIINSPDSIQPGTTGNLEKAASVCTEWDFSPPKAVDPARKVFASQTAREAASASVTGHGADHLVQGTPDVKMNTTGAGNGTEVEEQQKMLLEKLFDVDHLNYRRDDAVFSSGVDPSPKQKQNDVHAQQGDDVLALTTAFDTESDAEEQDRSPRQKQNTAKIIHNNYAAADKDKDRDQQEAPLALHVTINSGRHMAKEMRTLTGAFLAGKKTVWLPLGNGQGEIEYDLRPGFLEKQLVDLQVLGVFGLP